MRVGCPIRISTDQRLLAAPHGFSQRATSFIASWCQGIHRMPLSRSIRVLLGERSTANMHRNHPRENARADEPDHLSLQHSAHTETPLHPPQSPQLPTRIPTDRAVFRKTPLNVFARAAAPHALAQACGQTNAPQARPATHQNLIHTDKEHGRPTGTARPKRLSAPRPSPTAAFNHPFCRDQPNTTEPLPLLCDDTHPIPQPRHPGRTFGGDAHWWRRPLVETIGIEPMTPCLQSRCSPS